jgi:imidazole glycerol-phosphate synthase subunit HisH
MIAIIDYEAGNLASVERAVRSLGHECIVTQDHRLILSAQRVIFPGVGAAGAAMAGLSLLGLDRVIRQVRDRGTPLLGICLGTQIIFEDSQEDEGTSCLGLLPGTVKKFPNDLQEKGDNLKVPHMGWNQVSLVAGHPVLEGVRPEHEFYFVHSFYPCPSDQSLVIGWTDYGLKFASVVARDNLIASQFHPEKSGRPGLAILENFCRWDGKYAQP